MKNQEKHYDEILAILEKEYPDATTALHHRSPFELLVATILSAQCTDKQVNKVTEELFQKYNTPEDFAALDQGILEGLIRSCGFYKTKARNIIKTSQILVRQYRSKVPDELDALQKLPGVGRKTANVVVSNAFGKDAIAVDTHVFRVSNRLGLATAKDVFETEKQLMENIPQEKWSRAHHWLIYHGRRVCTARNPKCGICPLKEYCRYYQDHK
ncbi:MAG: endonuclease III [Clostridia bacterium]